MRCKSTIKRAVWLALQDGRRLTLVHLGSLGRLRDCGVYVIHVVLTHPHVSVFLIDARFLWLKTRC